MIRWLHIWSFLYCVIGIVVGGGDGGDGGEVVWMGSGKGFLFRKKCFRVGKGVGQC